MKEIVQDPVGEFYDKAAVSIEESGDAVRLTFSDGSVYEVEAERDQKVEAYFVGRKGEGLDRPAGVASVSDLLPYEVILKFEDDSAVFLFSSGDYEIKIFKTFKTR